MFGTKIRIVLGEQAHSSVFKALSLLGFGEDQLERVPADNQGRLAVEKMPELDDRTIVLVQAGNVHSGAFDPISRVCERALQDGAWVHVDGACGLWGAASGTRKHLVKGIEKADSWSVDAHKTLNAPYDCGIVLCRHPGFLLQRCRRRTHIFNTAKSETACCIRRKCPADPGWSSFGPPMQIAVLRVMLLTWISCSAPARA